MTGKYYVWEDIRSKNIMKEFHFIKALGKGTILKVGKIKVARKVDINTDSTKKVHPVVGEVASRGWLWNSHCSSAARGPGSD